MFGGVRCSDGSSFFLVFECEFSVFRKYFWCIRFFRGKFRFWFGV